MLEKRVSVDTTFFRQGEMEPLIEAAGFEVRAAESHPPVPFEFPMPSIYIHAVRRPGTSGEAGSEQV